MYIYRRAIVQAALPAKNAMRPTTCPSKAYHKLLTTNNRENPNNPQNFRQKCPQSTQSTTLTLDTPNQPSGILGKVLKKFGWSPDASKSRLRISSYQMYESIADRIVYKDFFDKFNMPNTFNSWFLVTELHVWMVLVRAMAEGQETGENGRFMRNVIVEALWSDVSTRSKKLGANNPSGTRAQIQILSQQFQAALIAYDEGLMGEDRVLAGALWQRFFNSNLDDYERLETLVRYVRKHIHQLDALSYRDFVIKPKITWHSINDEKI